MPPMSLWPQVDGPTIRRWRHFFNVLLCFFWGDGGEGGWGWGGGGWKLLKEKTNMRKKLCFLKLMMDGTCFGPVMFLPREKTGFFCWLTVLKPKFQWWVWLVAIDTCLMNSSLDIDFGTASQKTRKEDDWKAIVFCLFCGWLCMGFDLFWRGGLWHYEGRFCFFKFVYTRYRTVCSDLDHDVWLFRHLYWLWYQECSCSWIEWGWRQESLWMLSFQG